MTFQEINRAIELLNSDDKKTFWNLLEKEYASLKKKIVSKNSKNYNFITKKIQQSIEKEYFKGTIAKSKNLEQNFSDFTEHISNLILTNTDIDKKSDFYFYLNSGKYSSFASIAQQGDDKILVVFNRNAIRLFRKDIEEFDAIFLHEAAHLVQKDTNYLFKRNHFLSKRFFYRGLFNYFKSISFLLLIFIGLYIWLAISANKEDITDIDKIIIDIEYRSVTRQLFGKLFIFIGFAMFTALRYRFNIRKKNRLLSEYGADVFSVVKAKNLKFIEVLEAKKNQIINSKLHYPINKRIEMLLKLLSKNYKVLKKT